MPKDWTVDPKTGRSNSSKKFLDLCDEVDCLIRSSAHSLLNGQSFSAARLIMAQLAHKHKLAPREDQEK
jgi:hypothetical protein